MHFSLGYAIRATGKRQFPGMSSHFEQVQTLQPPHCEEKRRQRKEKGRTLSLACLATFQVALLQAATEPSEGFLSRCKTLVCLAVVDALPRISRGVHSKEPLRILAAASSKATERASFA